MADSSAVQGEQPRKKFAPKEPVQLQPPKDDAISTADLHKCDGEKLLRSCFPTPTCMNLHSADVTGPGTSSEHPTYVAIKGTVFDVSGNSAYAPNGAYHGKMTWTPP